MRQGQKTLWSEYNPCKNSERKRCTAWELPCRGRFSSWSSVWPFTEQFLLAILIRKIHFSSEHFLYWAFQGVTRKNPILLLPLGCSWSDRGGWSVNSKNSSGCQWLKAVALKLQAVSELLAGGLIKTQIAGPTSFPFHPFWTRIFVTIILFLSPHCTLGADNVFP